MSQQALEHDQKNHGKLPESEQQKCGDSPKCNEDNTLQCSPPTWIMLASTPREIQGHIHVLQVLFHGEPHVKACIALHEAEFDS
ncbi:hypothetical protein AVEN_266397-1 [Araneus ventricosus]|uniref:Uncharacterized protein n=1 Tax=Araneus ventricosus TaxID=182803 RepID=A0A4Y2F9G9_ARAVE|nr:hypothetical protein AVEN_266397-1 [Araneus ventricosus]